jgi:hypothetical protein
MSATDRSLGQTSDRPRKCTPYTAGTSIQPESASIDRDPPLDRVIGFGAGGQLPKPVVADRRHSPISVHQPEKSHAHKYVCVRRRGRPEASPTQLRRIPPTVWRRTKPDRTHTYRSCLGLSGLQTRLDNTGRPVAWFETNGPICPFAENLAKANLHARKDDHPRASRARQVR